MKSKYLWFTDTHLNNVLPWTKALFIRNIVKENPKGIFLTGDISNGLTTAFNLKLLANFVKCPIYFVLGNHDYYFSNINKTHNKIKEMCEKYPNLIWLTNSDVIGLTDQVAIIGTEGWYDAAIGKPEYLKYTLDWLLIEDFRKLNFMPERIEMFKILAEKSCQIISNKLQKALDQGYKSIYILTHFPPWKEATRDEGTIMEKFWLPYNVNLKLGKTIESIMSDYKKRNVTILSGHTHTDAWIHVSRNIECKVNKAKYYGNTRNEEHIFI